MHRLFSRAALFAALAISAALVSNFATPLVAQGSRMLFQNGTPIYPSAYNGAGTGVWFPADGVGLRGHIRQFGAGPVVSACGTGALTSGSTDVAGIVTLTGATGCTLTFGTSWTTTPFCLATEQSAVTAAMSVNTTATAVVFAAATSGARIAYFCIGRSA